MTDETQATGTGPSAEGQGGGRRRAALYAAFGLWFALTPFLGWFALSFLGRIWVSATGFAAGSYYLAILLTWKTLVLLALGIVAALVFSWLRRAGAAAGVAPGRLVAIALGGLALVTVGVFVWAVQPTTSFAEAPGPNRWGFWRSFPASTTMRWDPKNGEADYLNVTTNSYSYRDDEWVVPAPDDDVNRVLLVGDSVVLGLSIPEKEDQLDTLLEERLNGEGAASPGGTWDVWNIANSPGSLWFFSEAIRRVAADARPRYAIVVFYCNNDVTFFDEQMALADKPAWFHAMVRNTGVYGDLLVMASNPWPFSYEIDGSTRRELLGHFERLIEFCREQGIRLVVWDATGPCDLLAPYREEEGVTFLDWRTAVGESCGDDDKYCKFYEDPRYGHPSGHVTPLGNARIADVLAAALRELEAARRAAE